MSVFRLSLVVCLIIAVLVVAGGLFILLVNMDFTVSVPGRIEPARVLDVALPVQGRVAFARPLGPVRQGDLLLALDTDAEKQALEDAARQREAIQQELALEQTLAAAEARQIETQRSQAKRQIETLEQELQAETGRLNELSLQIETCLREQKSALANLRLDEEKMLSGLAGQGVVTKLEMAVAKQRADLAKSEELQIRLEAERDKLARQVKIEDLRSRLDVRRLDLAILKDRPQDLRRLLTLKRQVEELDARIADLSRTVKQKAFHAPFDGSVLSVTATVGEVLRAGDAGLVVGDNGPLLFRGVAAPSQRTDIHPGQAVRVRIENYPYLTFGAASGKVEGLSTRLPLDAAAAFCVTCSIQSAPFRLETGLVAIADVVIFHGTVVKYLMHRYRPAGGA